MAFSEPIFEEFELDEEGWNIEVVNIDYDYNYIGWLA
jgi:hypothetical protein